MKLISLYLENFMCYASTQIDFSSLNSALILGIQDNNDNISNGTGKSTIFKAIEYVLFNKARNLNLEKIIRDDTSKCKVVLDFEINNNIYRISRSRTIKGSSDLSLFERNSFESEGLNPHNHNLKEEQSKLFWNDISGRRINDTESDLQKLHKTNFESFLSTNHFIQNDFSGLASSTASQRKKTLKEALQLNYYVKLEKIANEYVKNSSKEIDKIKFEINSFGDLEKDIQHYSNNIEKIKDLIDFYKNSIKKNQDKYDLLNDNLNALNIKVSEFNNKSSSLLRKEIDLKNNLKKINNLLDDLNKKKKSAILDGKNLVTELNSLKEQELKLNEIDFSKLNEFQLEIDSLRELNGKLINNISLIKNEIEDLKIPFPDDAKCKHCRQDLSPEHKEICKNKIKEEIPHKENLLKQYNNDLILNKNKISNIEMQIKSLNESKSKLSIIAERILNKNNEIKTKKKSYQEYNELIENNQKDLIDIESQLSLCQNEISYLNKDEFDSLNNLIASEKEKILKIKSEIVKDNELLNKCFSEKGICENYVSEKKNNIIKKEELNKKLNSLNEDILIYSDVVEAFSSKGIPNLLVQNILEDFQIEANNILSQIKPGLQLSFSTEKVNKDGEVDDDLEINYYFNNKSRDYGQLSGAMSIAILFAIKLGFAFLLQKMIGSKINFLLIDEIDMPFDKSGVDAFVDIIKFFQKDFSIFIITHNDRLKDKFNNFIIVEQDKNMVSEAKVVSN